MVYHSLWYHSSTIVVLTGDAHLEKGHSRRLTLARTKKIFSIVYNLDLSLLICGQFSLFVLQAAFQFVDSSTVILIHGHDLLG